MESVSTKNNENNLKDNEPIFEIKKWNAVALWSWGKTNLF